MCKRIISFQGLPGAYSDLVCRKFFKDFKTLPCNTFEEAISSVEKKKASLAMIPVENNIAGRVADMHFLLEKIKLKIVAEHYHKIQHHLLGLKTTNLSDITRVYSHIHALSQCRKNIQKYNLEPINYIDTAGAAKFVSEKKDSKFSAIGSDLSSKIYGLKILKKNFEDAKNNITRFLVFSRSSIEVNKKKKVITSIVFNTKNLPASLYKALGGFAKNSVNLTRLESFFVNKDFKQFSFLIDVESHPETQNFKRALAELKKFASRVKILGFFEASSFRK
tara:strand:- start:6924 stop:7757 length:834 start_codon:yes stop_codon:yes gene_type:complete